MSKVYTVTILPFVVETPEQNGFIDDLRIEERTTDITSVTYDQCEAKWRGMERWQQIIEGISLVANPTILTSEAVDATATTDATRFVFTMKVDREGSLYLKVDDQEMRDEDALQYLVAQAIAVTQTKVCGVVVPTDGVIVRTVNLTIGALGDMETVLSNVTVTFTEV